MSDYPGLEIVDEKILYDRKQHRYVCSLCINHARFYSADKILIMLRHVMRTHKQKKRREVKQKRHTN